MPFFETSLLEFHRGAKKWKNPKTPRAQLSGSNSPEVELQARETEKHAVKQELRILFQYALMKVFCKSAVFPTAPGPTKLWLCPSTGLTLSTENGIFQRQVALPA